MTRQEINRIIIKEISDYNERYSDLRFNQILINLDISQLKPEIINGVETGEMLGLDLFNEESSKTLKRLEFIVDKKLI
jgi:hypothetical protein